jgi:Domain of unknown function (DUF4399)
MNPLAKITGLLTMVICGLLLSSVARAEHPAVYIISPAHGEVVSNPVQVRFGLRGMGVAPAGTDKANTGHHHLLIDVDQLPAMDQPVPSDANHRHFGKGQTEVELTLEPGKHTLQLLLGDMGHMPHSPAMVSEKITINVE